MSTQKNIQYIVQSTENLPQILDPYMAARFVEQRLIHTSSDMCDMQYGHRYIFGYIKRLIYLYDTNNKQQDTAQIVSTLRERLNQINKKNNWLIQHKIVLSSQKKEHVNQIVLKQQELLHKIQRFQSTHPRQILQQQASLIFRQQCQDFLITQFKEYSQLIQKRIDPHYQITSKYQQPLAFQLFQEQDHYILQSLWGNLDQYDKSAICRSLENQEGILNYEVKQCQLQSIIYELPQDQDSQVHDLYSIEKKEQTMTSENNDSEKVTAKHHQHTIYQ